MILILPLPASCLHPNARACWQEIARATKQSRGEAALVARTAQDRPRSPWEKATVQATFYLPRARDGDGLTSWIKAVLDGLQDGGVIENDSGFTVLPPIQFYGKGLDYRLELSVEKDE